ncbi:MAG: class I SAM-dependent methyltransferase [Acidobacteriia bacterium]|nr:class I SAM-dependent methyltransferase [Terriglobia bacterium]
MTHLIGRALRGLRRGLGLGRSRPRLSPAERRQKDEVDSVCIGYSGDGHWNFFRTIARRPNLRKLCVLGVYHGRDVAYLSALLAREGRGDAAIVGVDKFEDTPCKDWPESASGLSWRQAGFGEPPDIETTRRNLARLGLDRNVSLRKQEAESFLAKTAEVFDFIYVDTSHDYHSTDRTIRLAMRRLNPDGTIAGDDFSDRGTWGVASAVRDSFVKFEVLSDWIWLARPSDYRGARGADEA